MTKEFIVGSNAFFGELEGFHSKDEDTLILTDEPNDFEHYRQRSMSGQCTFEWAKKPKADFITYAKRDKESALEFGKFLVSAFAEEIGLTIADLKDLYAFYEPKIDKPHEYQKTIAKAFFENDAFVLTDKQRAEAYEVYKSARTERGVTDEADLRERSAERANS